MAGVGNLFFMLSKPKAPPEKSDGARMAFYSLIPLVCPLAVYENGGSNTILVAGDLHVLRANHEVDVDHALVDAKGVTLLVGHVKMSLDAVVEAAAECDMAAGVLVEQRFIEQDAALIDGAGARDECQLAEAACAVVHGQHAVEQFLALFSIPLDSLAVFKTDPEILDQLTLVGQRLGGDHLTLCLALHGRGEDLLGGHVGIEVVALLGVLTAAAPLTLRDQIGAEIGAVGALVGQIVKLLRVEPVATLLEVFVMARPLDDGIVVGIVADTDSVQNGFPKCLDRLRFLHLGEHLLCPCGAGNSGNGPLMLGLDGIAVGLDDGIGRHLRLLHLFHIDALESVGILAGDVNADGTVSVLDIIMLQTFLLNTGDLTNSEAADLCADGRIDGFDLCMMKRELLKQN